MFVGALRDYLAPLLFGGLLLCVSGLAWYQSDRADDLEVKLVSLNFQKTQTETANKALQRQLLAEQQAVQEMQNFANDLQEQTNAKTERVRTVFKSEPCAGTALPSVVVEQLR